GPSRMVDRHEKNVAPLCRDGRMFVSGDNYLVAVDAYNGTILWERDLPESIRLGAFKNCGSMAVDEKSLYVAAAGKCLALDVRTGKTQRELAAPADCDGKPGEWGYVATLDGRLLGTTTKAGANWRVEDVDTQTLIWRDNQPVVTSDALFAFDSQSGGAAWEYRPQSGVIVNPTLAAGLGRVYFVESADPKTFAVADGRIKLDLLFDRGARLVALDLQTGKPAWQSPLDLAQLEHMIFLSYADDTLLITGTRNAKVEGSDKPRVRYDLWAFDAPTGKPLWNSTQVPVPDHILEGPHGEQVQHSAIVGRIVHNTGFACHLRTGEPYAGWKWQKSDKCGTLSASASCIFSRFVTPRMFSIQSGEYLSLTSVTRPGCWINILPAGGLVLIPEASAGCTCYYPIQTSIALAPR
ncbi:MAG: outer membrane protein assembly factor BamB family protein, partial [Thermoguttaceae bacterium]